MRDQPRQQPNAPADALRMALNTVVIIAQAAEYQERDPAQAHVRGVGKVAMDSAIIGGCLALISIAADVRRLADDLTGEGE